MQQKLQKLRSNFLFFLELQLLISIVILPILIAWGLPISIMAIIGNLIFAQFLTAFIFVSALLFVSDLFGIPTYWIIQALELITNIWYYFLSLGSSHWLLGFSSWVFIVSSIFAIIALSLYFNKIQNQIYRITVLTILCLMPLIIHNTFQSKNVHTTILQGSQKMHLIKAFGKVYAFDCGALSARPNNQSWIEYNVTPTMIKTIGTTNIDLLVICKSNSRTHQAIQDLRLHIPVHSIVHLSQNQSDFHIPSYMKNLQSIDF